MFVFNSTAEDQTTQAFGNWFTFKPKQIKSMTENIGHFLCTQRADHGFVGLSEAFEDPAYKNTAEGKAEYLTKEKQGIAAYLQRMHQVVANNTQSLGRDLQMANIQADPRAFMSDGELAALEILAKYKSAEQDEADKRLSRAKELEDKLGLTRK